MAQVRRQKKEGGEKKKKTGIKAEEFTRNMVGLMFIRWNIIVTFLLHYSTGVELRIRPRFVSH